MYNWFVESLPVFVSYVQAGGIQATFGINQWLQAKAESL